ncbi:hypothetical protein SUGI_0542140 [Cryptomeria japonica]|nr:hypothetical protein SUGI_0542140 [Cryptomeria japonica]
MLYDGYEFRWIFFNHPYTFNCLALDPTLLFVPPGTGKSSLIAAIANYMKYDIYHFELSKVASNGKLQLLPSKTMRKSIILVEDIDCSLSESSPHPKSIDDYNDV